LITVPSALPESIRQALQQAPLVALPSVPALWQAWADAGILSSRIRIAISAGAPLPLTLEQRVFESAGLKIHNFYGSSECGGIAYDGSHQPRERAALAGGPLPGVELSVNPEGCLTVRSEAVGLGYWPDADAVLEGGQFQTGDLAFLDHGAVYLQGRASDRINVAGRKVLPDEVERVLVQHPGVRDCLVFGVPADNIRHETIVACVSAGSGISSRQLTDFLQDRLPSWQVPRQWWMVDSLAVNGRGKRSRAEWRRRYLHKHGVQHVESD
jgi:acyl-CoA synthetase (AMP-forming)/AMP-acid ligase II